MINHAADVEVHVHHSPAKGVGALCVSSITIFYRVFVCGAKRSQIRKIQMNDELHDLECGNCGVKWAGYTSQRRCQSCGSDDIRNHGPIKVVVKNRNDTTKSNGGK